MKILVWIMYFLTFLILLAAIPQSFHLTAGVGLGYFFAVALRAVDKHNATRGVTSYWG